MNTAAPFTKYFLFFQYFPILFMLVPAVVFSGPGDTDTTLQRPMIDAIRRTGPISIDGILSEQEWHRAGIDRFTQHDPVEGSQPTEKTEVWIAYDDAAIYIAARMYDRAPDSIVARMGRRDADLSSDWFYVGIDSYHDRRTGFYFTVYASGTVTDGTLYNDSWDDNSWDGVWDAATNIDDKGWTTEMRIPFSQLRFPKQDEYVWGINFIRQIERRKERDDFILVPKKESGWVSRFADLQGLKEISPPLKLEILPYTLSKFRTTNRVDAGDPLNKENTFSSNIGADIKFGLGTNLTVNATINPDFGQVEVDPAVVNLTQFETFFDEKRPFFIEGSNFFDFGQGGANSNYGFNWGSPNFFYSRRIGRSPEGDVQHSGYVDYPDGTRILGAAKLTGKITNEWSLATLSAATQRMYAQVDDGSGNHFADVVEPFSFYNVVRSQREFNQGKQAVGIIGTATFHDLNQPYLVDNYNRNSFSLGIDGWTNIDADQEYVVTGWLSTTHVEGTSNRILSLQQAPLHYFQRPDAQEAHGGYVSVDSNATSLSGYAGRFAVNKQKGNVIFNTAVGFITPGFETNDLGFLFRTDVINAHITTGYNWFEPDGIFRRKSFNIATFRNYDFGGHKVGEGYFLFYNAQFTNYWGLNGSFNFNPAVLDNRNTRGGPSMKNTNGYGIDWYINTDSRNALTFNGGISMGRTESGGYRFSHSYGVEWRPSAGMIFSFGPDINNDVTIAQWVTKQTDPTATATYGTRYIFARLDLKEISGNVRIDWTFTPKLSLQLFIQPLISVGTYNQFKELKQPGTYTFNRYGENGSTIAKNGDGDYTIDPDGTGANTFVVGNPDFNFKSLRGNAVLRWEYLPGSTAYFVWTRNSMNFDNAGDVDFGRDFRTLVTTPDHEDVFLIKLAYWWNPK